LSNIVKYFTKIAPKIVLQKNYGPISIAKTYFFWAQFCAKLHSKMRHLDRHVTSDANALELLEDNRKRCIQEIVGSLLYYAQAVHNKLLVVLSAIAACQAKATVATEQAVNLLVDYVATYPNDGIVYHTSNMILCAHTDAGFLNKTNSSGRVGAHIYLSENNPFL
jgi:hypothetical protein